ncbi:hypothetical protein JYK14_20885 [Siccirubricoccus sp. KC 17139]|uniref:General secretion pathway protein N n=1 Tax=Siccirubricoccus soli TaxID=2899147 RepID=A0ABT1D9J1_9PROT|nr:hypothetical protein [Siccirubricoccus soli]MCO6418596.1 hypothetical protein [Siccirubricoccus soli]MCP2684731.1 hypothetical protein [Siccirubricoccus soli]
MLVFHSLRALARAMTLCVLIVAALPAQAVETVTPAQSLTGQTSRAVLAEPGTRLRWDAPGRGWWALGEATPTAAGMDGNGSSYRAAVVLGGRHQFVARPDITLALLPELRMDAAGGAYGTLAAPALGASLRQEAALSLPGGARFQASIGLGDQLAVVPLPDGGGGDKLTVRAAASLASDIGSVAGMPLRAELQVAAVRHLELRGMDRPASCELKLELRRPSAAPLRLASGCPGTGAPKLTIGISGRF